MAKKKEELLFIAECTYDADETKHCRVWVYKRGKSFLLRSMSADGYPHEHPGHPTARNDEEGIKREIAIVYQVTVNRILYPWELNKS
jgi:hypothetical protein